jgi:large subunit ribosomal protein L30
MFIVIRIRGTNSVDKRVEDTMRMIRLKAANNCTLLPETDEVKGMLQKAKDFITWGEISKETLAKLLEKRLRTRVNEKKIVAENLKEITKFDSFDALAGALIEGKEKINKIDSVHPMFRLTPPSKGFKSVTDAYPRGDLGYRGKEINGLVERMI